MLHFVAACRMVAVRRIWLVNPTATTNPLRLSLTLVAPHGGVDEGATFALTVRAVASHDVTFSSAEVDLIRTFTYDYHRGPYLPPERTTVLVDQSSLDGIGALAAGESLEREVTLTVPMFGPGTTNGRLIQVQWAVRARFVMPGHRDAVLEKVIDVRTQSWQSRVDLDAPPHEESRGKVSMSFEGLSSRTLVPGGTLSGSVRVEAHKQVAARAIRVELLLEEQVEHGPSDLSYQSRRTANDSKETQTVIVRSVLDSAAFEFEEDRKVLRVPFVVDVPTPLPAPSLLIPGFRIRWILRACVDIPRSRDPQLTVSMLAVTASPGICR